MGKEIGQSAGMLLIPPFPLDHVTQTGPFGAHPTPSSVPILAQYERRAKYTHIEATHIYIL